MLVFLMGLRRIFQKARTGVAAKVLKKSREKTRDSLQRISLAKFSQKNSKRAGDFYHSLALERKAEGKSQSADFFESEAVSFYKKTLNNEALADGLTKKIIEERNLARQRANWIAGKNRKKPR